MAYRIFLTCSENELALCEQLKRGFATQCPDVEFADCVSKEPFERWFERSATRARLDNEIRRSDMTLCVYGPETYKSGWVDWELMRTLHYGKPIMGVRSCEPARIRNYPLSLKGWPRISWNLPKIVSVVEQFQK